MSGLINEASFFYQLSKGRTYTLFIYYSGEINYDDDGNEVCDYYNLALSIKSMANMKKSFECFNDSAYKSIDDLPSVISDNNFMSSPVYKLEQFYEIKLNAGTRLETRNLIK